MHFRIHHRTRYRYAGTASESFMEARLQPLTDDTQTLLEHRLVTSPASNVHTYTDYFGNTVETFSIVRRHEELLLDSFSEVETKAIAAPEPALDVSVSEARQIYRSEKLKLFEFLAPSGAIPLTEEINRLANRFFRPGDPLGPALLRLNRWIKETFRYQAGATRIDTSMAEVLRGKVGVCQDFAQVMIAVLRSAEIPARYVVGYIETETQRRASEAAPTQRVPKLIGAAESHAWVDVYLPGGFWWPLDPTNDCVAGERHVKVALGRDYQDNTPTRGVFKGTFTEQLAVAVLMQRV
ncbi:MAG TPA: transglutaminase family protein [Candidatus Synoicihabitans sp.]|nr:transglutaminase family protein [Candidatus Synoicihabitans sp.]